MKIKRKTAIYAGAIILILVLGTPFMMGLGGNSNSKNKDSPSSQMSSAGGGSMAGHHGGSAVPKSSNSALKVGDLAPDFSLKSVAGETVKLSDFDGKNLVIFFNEGAMCYPSCWNQMLALATDKRFNNEDTATVAIVVDTRQAWKSIIAEKAPRLAEVTILADSDKEMSSAYGAMYMESSMHPGQFPGHSYFIVDKEGVIRYILDDANMQINNEVLAGELEKL